MLKKQGIVALLLLFTTLFLFIADNLLFSHNSVSAQSSQIVDASFKSSDSSSSSQTYRSKPLSTAPEANSVESPLSQSGQSSDSQAILSTSYKRYTLYRYNDFYILCEPYTVQDGDWIYKIFRSKGELSKEDFGMFMRIFKNLNPNIKDTNTIKTGQRITIPLKKSKYNDFKESSPGVVELPTITLSQLTDASKPIKKPISDKKTLSDTYKTNASKKKPSAEIPVRHLKQFAALNDGKLMLKGKYYFPRDNQDDLVIDVAFNPLMQFKNGSRILFVPEISAFEGCFNTIKTFWHDFKIIEFKEVTSSSLYEPQLSMQSDDTFKYNHQINSQFELVEPLEDIYVPINMILEKDHKAAVKKLLEITKYNYTPEKEISLSVGNITVTVTPGIITREGSSDILVVFGDIYGSALEALKEIKQGDILTISPLLTTIDVTKKIFSVLGASTTENPAFVNPSNGKTLSIEGIHVKISNQELFITQKSVLLKEAFRYLIEKNITILRTDDRL
ncbi:MAG: LysM peptidoglycan-binding domain-containing protein [Desulfamplus sp.]|nr:LysM peptidoglycan-binding domain-containing protein [Desulfamplus sp.]